MIDILFRIKSLNTVVQAVYRPLWLLVSTFMLVISFLFILAVIYYERFGETDFLDEEMDGRKVPVCDNMIRCILYAIDTGLREGGGLGDALLLDFEYAVTRFDTYHIQRIVFDVISFLVIQTILLQMFFGIIVDTFADIRDERNHISQDQRTYCFICGLPSSTLNFKGNGFDHHTTKEHNMWSYFFYYVYLQKKAQTEYTPIEGFVDDCCRSYTNQVKWFPEHRALAVREDDDAQAFRDIVSTAMSGFSQNQSAVMNSIRALSSSVTEIRQELRDLQEMSVRRRVLTQTSMDFDAIRLSTIDVKDGKATI